MAKRVSVVDDDVNIRTALKLRLERDSLIVHTAADGEDALAQIAALHPDLVILDLALPRRDGLDVLAWMRSNTATAHVPVIILTARYRRGEATPAALSQAEEVIGKPFSPRYLAERVHSLLASG